MNFLLIAAVTATLTVALPNRAEETWLMFFMKGPVKRTGGEEEGKKFMEGHFANMKKQVALGRMFAAGPLNDPTTERRGITVVGAEDRAQVNLLFNEDPFVKADIMRVDAGKWKVVRDRFDPNVDSSTIVEHRLLLFKRGKGMSPETAAMRSKHEKDMNGFMKGTPCVWGKVDGFQGILEAMIVLSKDEDVIKRELAKDPYVSRNLLEVEVLPLWMSKGVVKE